MDLIQSINKDELFDEPDFMKDLEIDLDDLSSTIQEHSPHYFRYGKLHCIATEMVSMGRIRIDTLKQGLENTKARLAVRIREEMLLNNEKPTDTSVANRVLDHDDLKKAQTEFNEAREQLVRLEFTESILALTENVFRKRTDLLVSLGYSMAGARRADFEVHDRSETTRMRADIERMREDARSIIRRNRQGRE